MLLTDAEAEGQGVLQLTQTQSLEVSKLLSSMREAVGGNGGSGSSEYGAAGAEYGDLGPDMPYGSDADAAGDLLRLDSLGSIK
jgi:hypothetical protein